MNGCIRFKKDVCKRLFGLLNSSFIHNIFTTVKWRGFLHLILNVYFLLDSDTCVIKMHCQCDQMRLVCAR